MTSLLTELRPPSTRPTEPPAPSRQQPSTVGYWLAAIVAVLGLTAALVWGAVGTVTALDQVDNFDRVAVSGAMTVSVTDPGTRVVYYEGPTMQARYADPTATAATRADGTRPPTPPSWWTTRPPPRPGSSSGCR